MLVPDCASGPPKWDYNWTQPRLQSFIEYLRSQQVTKMAFWRSDIDDEGNCTQPYYFAAASAFLAGK